MAWRPRSRPNALFDEECAEHATSVWHPVGRHRGTGGRLGSGTAARRHARVRLPARPRTAGRPRFGAEPQTRSCTRPTTVSQGEPSGPALGTETGLAGKIKGAALTCAPARRKPAVTGTATGPPDGACGWPDRWPQAPACRKE